MSDTLSAGVYILSEGPEGPCKIGRTTRKSRFKALQTGNPRELFPEWFWGTSRAADAEYRIHQKLASYRLRGEWFNVSVSVASRVMDDVMIEFGETPYWMKEGSVAS